MIKDAVQFIREVRTEALKVTWPSKKEVSTTTVVVFIMIAIMSVILLAADFLISNGIQAILDLGK
ncbi:MAG: preprotein translocase subunit SecE [Alphaproteobacteria bacterium]|nr:MAG: preprotein translocase subunit SecE [Alphaproteobacteria bacterium]